jgi:tetratricopeptide (TPR) repeat protein
VACDAQGRYADARPYLEEAAAGRSALRPTHPETFTSRYTLGSVYRSLRRHAEAERLLRQALADARKAFGDAHWVTLDGERHLAVLLYDSGRFGEAVPLLEAAARGYGRQPEDAVFALACRSYLGLALAGAGDPAAAEPHLLAGYGGLKGQERDLDRRNRALLRAVAQGLAELYGATNPAKAADWRAKVAALPLEIAPPPRPATAVLSPLPL